MIRVLLSDDQPVVRAGLRGLIELDPQLVVAAEAGDGVEAEAEALRVRPDVILMDLQMPRGGGVAAIRSIRSLEELRDTAIVVLTTFNSAQNIAAAIDAGALGFLVKTAELDELHAAIHAVARGVAPMSVDSLRLFRAGRPAAAEPPAELDALTARERQVVLLAAEGRANADIARLLFLSPLTVKTHVNRAMSKLGVSDRTALVLTVLRAPESASAPPS